MPAKKLLIFLSVCTTLLTFSLILTPYYTRLQETKRISKLIPLVDSLQQKFVLHAKTYGYFPESQVMQLESTKLYDITTWSNERSLAKTATGQIAVIQGQINGQELGLVPGDGGMVTCLMALRNANIESKCFYQIKPM